MSKIAVGSWTPYRHLFQGLEVDRSSYVDPNGFVVHRDNSIFRVLHPDKANFYQGLFDSGLIERLVDHYHLVPTTIDRSLLPSDHGIMALNHDKVWPLTYCVEWCLPMQRQAALVTLELALELANYNLMLQDAYPWNVLFRGAQPLFVDFTSITPQDDRLIWPACSQFQAFFLRPLILFAQGKGEMARLMMLDQINGVTLERFYRAVSLPYLLRHPGFYLEYALDKWIQKHYSLKLKMRAMVERSQAVITLNTRKRFLKGLIRKVDHLPSGVVEDPWRNYYARLPGAVEKEKKITIVQQIISRLNPKTVTDLGANTGVFSLIAARCGALVIAIDNSESCMSTLYESARKQNLPITPVVSNVLCPTPAFGFLSEQFPALLERAKAELVLCLGLMHHLHISGRQAIASIARQLARMAEKCVIFEFVAKEDENNLLLTVNRPIDYTLATVTEALREEFQQIEEFPSDRASRKILLCSK